MAVIRNRKTLSNKISVRIDPGCHVGIYFDREQPGF